MLNLVSENRQMFLSTNNFNMFPTVVDRDRRRSLRLNDTNLLTIMRS